MNTAGRQHTPTPPPNPYGVIDNFFFDPFRRDEVTFGGSWDAQNEAWYFSVDEGPGWNVNTGDPSSNAVARGPRIFLRSLAISASDDKDPTGTLTIGDWDGDTHLGWLLEHGVPLNLDFGIMGIELGPIPFITTTIPISFNVTYDIIQGRFP